MTRTILKFFLSFFYRVEVKNFGQQFNQQKQLIIANHQSFIDGLLLGLFLPIKPVFVVHTTIVNQPIFKFLLKFVDYLAIDTTKPMAMKKIVHLINTGRPVVIFPEGRITLSGGLMKIYDGTAFVAFKSNAAIIPIWIDGAVDTIFARKGHGRPRKICHKITINIFKEDYIKLDENIMARQKRALSGIQMRKMMEKASFESKQALNHNVYSRLLECMDLFGKNYAIAEDKEQLETGELKSFSELTVDAIKRKLGLITPKEYTYKYFMKVALGVGHALEAKTEEKETIGILLPNVFVTPALVVGLNLFKRLPALLNYTSGFAGMSSACHTANIKTIVTSRKFLAIAKLEEVVQKLIASGLNIIYLEDVKSQMTSHDKMWLLGYALNNLKSFGQHIKPTDPFVILFTSGSESNPKGVVLSHEAILSNVDQVNSIIDLNPLDKLLNALPLFHSFGLTGGTMLPLLSGVPFIIYPSPLHYKIIPNVSYDRNCTVIFGTNTFLAQYGKNAHPFDFQKMRYIVAGAEKLTDSVKSLWIDKFGKRILEGYGTTECSPVISVNTPVAYKANTVGQILPGMKYQLLPVDGIEPETLGGRVGAFHVAGPNVMSGYLLYENPGVIKMPENELGENWYATGDIIEIDSEGFIHIRGRMKRFIKIAGEMVSLENVEKVARLASNVGIHAATSKLNPTKGEYVVLYTTDKTLVREKLSFHARELGFTELIVARDIRYIDAIPLLGTGKIDYVTLKKMASDS